MEDLDDLDIDLVDMVDGSLEPVIYADHDLCLAINQDFNAVFNHPTIEGSNDE